MNAWGSNSGYAEELAQKGMKKVDNYGEDKHCEQLIQQLAISGLVTGARKTAILDGFGLATSHDPSMTRGLGRHTGHRCGHACSAIRVSQGTTTRVENGRFIPNVRANGDSVKNRARTRGNCLYTPHDSRVNRHFSTKRFLRARAEPSASSGVTLRPVNDPRDESDTRDKPWLYGYYYSYSVEMAAIDCYVYVDVVQPCCSSRSMPVCTAYSCYTSVIQQSVHEVQGASYKY
eukprot:14044-Heterococcus_DN1.PRE.2